MLLRRATGKSVRRDMEGTHRVNAPYGFLEDRPISISPNKIIVYTVGVECEGQNAEKPGKELSGVQEDGGRRLYHEIRTWGI